MHCKWKIWPINRYNQTFFSKIRQLFSMLKKGQGRPTPLIPLLFARVLRKVHVINVEIHLVPKWFICNLQPKKATGWQVVKTIDWRGILSTTLFSSKNMKKNIPLINNDGEHAREFEDGGSSLQLFSCNDKADSRIALHNSKSRANVMVVLKNNHFDTFCL